MNKKGEPYGYYGRRDALKPEDFAAVLVYARTKVADLAVRDPVRRDRRATLSFKGPEGL